MQLTSTVTLHVTWRLLYNRGKIMKRNSKIVILVFIVLAVFFAVTIILMSKSYSEKLSYETLQKEELSAEIDEKAALLLSAETRNT